MKATPQPKRCRMLCLVEETAVQVRDTGVRIVVRIKDGDVCLVEAVTELNLEVHKLRRGGGTKAVKRELWIVSSSDN